MANQRWEERALAAVTGKRRQGHRGRKAGFTLTPSEFASPQIRTHITFSPEFLRLLDFAAQRRDVNRSTYMRRAAALLISADLDLPIGDVLHHSPCPGPFSNLQYTRGGRDKAVGIADWCPHPGCDGSHLRRAE